MIFSHRGQPWFSLVLLASSIAMGGGSDPIGGRPIDGVRISLDPWVGREKPLTLERGASERMNALAAVLSAAVPSKDHKCRNVGTLELRFRDGGTSVLGLLPGHDAEHYQLRLFSGDGHYEVLQVPRGAFLAALEQLGVPVAEAGFPR